MARLDVTVVGGCGHVGLPLALAFTSRGLRTAVYDVNQAAVAGVSAGRMPFDEPGAGDVLQQVLGGGRFEATSDPAILRESDAVVVVIGTPIDKHLNPEALRRSDRDRQAERITSWMGSFWYCEAPSTRG